MTGDELLKRRVENRCIGCGDPHPGHDAETGFVARYCAACTARMESQPGPGAGSGKARKAHKEQGIANLDALTGRLDTPKPYGHSE